MSQIKSYPPFLETTANYIIVEFAAPIGNPFLATGTH